MQDPMTHQTASYDWCQKIKNLGFRRPCVFWWVISGDGEWQLWTAEELTRCEWMPWKIEDDAEYVPAYTVADFGEAIPFGIRTTKGNGAKWRVFNDNMTNFFDAEIEADSRAQLLIHLIETGAVESARL